MTTWTVAYQVPLSMGFSSKNTGVGSHALLQGIFLTQGSKLHLLHCRQILYHLSHQGSPLFFTGSCKLCTIPVRGGEVAACGILVPLPGIEPGPPALEAWSLIRQTTREVPCLKMFLRFESLLCGMSEQIWMVSAPMRFSVAPFHLPLPE